jgi:hypothetical protein
VHQSFLYKREKAVGEKVYWTCRDHALYGCRSRAITQGQRVTVMRGHCHPPDMEGLEARRQQERAMEKLQARRDGPGGCEDKLLPGVDSLCYHRGPGTLTLTRPRPRKRAEVKDQELATQLEAPQGSPHEDQDLDPGKSASWGLAERGPHIKSCSLRPRWTGELACLASLNPQPALPPSGEEIPSLCPVSKAASSAFLQRAPSS